MTDNEIILTLSHMLEPINSKIQNMQNNIESMQSNILDIQNRIKKIELTQENIILPRLQNIEACYTSTFERYKNNVDEHEMMKQDISVLKIVLAEHSEKLQRIS